MIDRSGIDKFLDSNNIKCRDTEKIAEKIASMKQGGYSSLQVLADFDYTISHCRLEAGGEKMSSSFGALERYSGMSEEFRARTKALHDYYYNLEIDPNIEHVEKTRLMTEWFTKSAGCIISEGVTVAKLADAAATSRVAVRAKFTDFTDKLKKEEIPLLVFSAGVGQIIEQVLTNLGMSISDIKLIANMLEFDGTDTAMRFSSPLITTGNKAKVAAEQKEYFNSHADRVNSILLGDNIEDIQMGSCVKEYSKNLLTIGFLNDRVEDRLDLYLDTFDVVVLNDPDFSDINQLLATLQ